MSNLAALIDDVEVELRDTGNANWSVAEITAHLLRALHAYNDVAPQRTAGKLDTVADQREYDLSSLTGLMEVTDVWFPYDSTDEQHPPNRPTWNIQRDAYLYLDVPDVSGDADEDIRIFYTIPHTIQDLESATATTLDAPAETLVVMGASAYAAQQYGQSLIGKVTVSGWTPKQLNDWAAIRIMAFKEGLEAVRRRAIIMQDTRTQWKATHRHEGRGGIV